MKQITRSIFFVGLLLTACKSDDKTSKEIAGEWHGVSWTSEGKPVVPDASVLTLILAKEGVYNLIMDSRVENGDWKVKSDSLFLSPEKTEDVKMKIVSLTSDKLQLQMDRGRIEILDLKR